MWFYRKEGHRPGISGVRSGKASRGRDLMKGRVQMLGWVHPWEQQRAEEEVKD